VSVSYTQIIPEDPRFTATPEGEKLALSLLRAFLPKDEVTAKHFDAMQFVDPGENFERILCPHCHTEIASADWDAWLDRAGGRGTPKSGQ